MALQLALGGSLVAARGFSHPEVEPAYERARFLCEAVSDARRLGLALIGLAVFYYTRGEVERGRVSAARVLTAAQQSGDRGLAHHGHIQVAIPEYYQGKFTSALAHLQAAGTLFEADQHEATVSALAIPSGITMNTFAELALWALGRPDRALASAREAAVLARQLGHLFGLAFALFHETVVHWLRHDGTAQCERAAETIALSEAQGFPLWLGLGRVFHAAARVAGGEPEAIADMLAGLAVGAETGNQVGAPALFALLGEAYMTGGQFAQARGAVETGLTVATQTGQGFFDAELQAPGRDRRRH